MHNLLPAWAAQQRLSWSCAFLRKRDWLKPSVINIGASLRLWIWFFAFLGSWDAVCAQASAETNLLWMAGGHTDEINAIAFSPDGTRLATASDDQTLKIWNLENRALLCVCIGHTNDVQSVAFAPDGRQVVSGSMDNTVRFWNAGTGELLKTLAGVQYTNALEPGPRFSMALSPDGARVACCMNYFENLKWSVVPSILSQTCRVQTVLQLRQASDGALLRTLVFEQQQLVNMSPHPAGAVAFSPDGALIAVNAGSDIFISQTADGRLVQKLSDHTADVESLAFSPDGGTLASSSVSSIRLWRVADGSLLRNITGQSGTIRSIAWSSDGTRIASGCFDGWLRLWNAQSGSKLWEVSTTYNNRVRAVAVSPEGKWVASSDRGGYTRLFDIQKGSPGPLLTAHGGPVSSVAFSPDESQVLSASFSYVGICNIWQAGDGKLLDTHAAINISPAFSRDSQQVVLWRRVKHYSSILDFYDPASEMPLRTIVLPEDQLWGPLALSPDGLTIAVGQRDWKTTLWQISTGKRIASFESRSGRPVQLDYSPDGKFLVEGHSNHELLVRQPVNGDVVYRLNGDFFGFTHDGSGLYFQQPSWPCQIIQCQLSDGRQFVKATLPADTNQVLVAVLDGCDTYITKTPSELAFWRMPDGVQLNVMHDFTQGIDTFATSPSERLLAFGRSDGVLVVARNSLVDGIIAFPQPSIDVAPQNLTMLPDSEGALWVVARGDLPLSYQWFHNEEIIASATNSLLRFKDARAENSGNYRVEISDAKHAVASATARVTVGETLRILSLTENATLNWGENTALSVTAVGSSTLQYQWQFNHKNIPDATNASLVLSQMHPARSGDYRVVVIQDGGSCTSAPCAVTATAPMHWNWSFALDPTNEHPYTLPSLALAPEAKYVSAALSPRSYFFGDSNEYIGMNWSLMIKRFTPSGSAAADLILASGNTNPPAWHLLSPSADALVFGSDTGPIELLAWQGSEWPSGSSLRRRLLYPSTTNGAFIVSRDNTAFSADGKTLMMAGPGFMHAWSVAEAAEPITHRWDWPGGTVASLSFGPNPHSIVASANGILGLWPLDATNPPLVLSSNLQWRAIAVLSPNGQWLATSVDEGLISLRRIGNEASPQVLAGPIQPAQSLQFSPDSALLAAGCNGQVYFWRVADGQPLPAQQNTLHGIVQMVFFPGGDRIACLDNWGVIGVFDNPFAALEPYELRCRQEGILSDGRLQAVFYGPTGAIGVIQDSNDLIHWHDLEPISFNSNALHRILPAATMAASRFYRAKLTSD